MNNIEIKNKVHQICKKILNEKGQISSIDLLLQMNILKQKDYENWIFGKIDYLERVCKINLSKLNFILKELVTFSKINNLKTSITVYKGYGKNKKNILIFSKSKNKNLELMYSSVFLKEGK